MVPVRCPPCTEEEEESGQCNGNSKIPWVDWLAYNEARYDSATDPVIIPAGDTAAEVRMRTLCRHYAEVVSASDNPGALSEWNVGDPVEVNVIDPEFGICLIDSDPSDQDDSVDDAVNQVALVNLTPDPHCFLTPDGPHKTVSGGGNTYGAAFSSYDPFRQGIYSAQWGQRYPSGFGSIYAPKIVTDAGTWRNPAWIPSPRGFDSYYALQNTLGVNDPDRVNFDHIIPAKDSQGCKCGKNSNSNLALVSRSLNIGMSNNIRHPARKALLQQWTQQ